MKRLVYIFSTVVFLFLTACTKRVELDIIESKCKDFAISNADSEFLNPNCPNTITGNTLRVYFDYDGDQECLNSIEMVVKFYNSNDEVVIPKTISADSLHYTDPSVSIGSGSARFDVAFEMNSEAEYENLSYVTVNFSTKNENLNLSNKLAVVEIFPCKTLPPPSSTSGTIPVKNTSIKVSIWDNAAEDGDVITIIVNGVVVANNVQIFNDPKTFFFTIDPNIQNYIRFYAVNEGTSSPNTASGTIDDGVSTQSFSVGMKQGESISYTLQYQGL